MRPELHPCSFRGKLPGMFSLLLRPMGDVMFANCNKQWNPELHPEPGRQHGIGRAKPAPGSFMPADVSASLSPCGRAADWMSIFCAHSRDRTGRAAEKPEELHGRFLLGSGARALLVGRSGRSSWPAILRHSPGRVAGWLAAAGPAGHGGLSMVRLVPSASVPRVPCRIRGRTACGGVA